MLTVVALGGNALMRPGERGTAAEQRANLRETAEALRPLFGDGDLVVGHGNGPQVGNELVRQERAADEVPPLPLYLAIAQTQAEIGAMIEIELGPVAGRPVVCVLTHVRVDENDPDVLATVGFATSYLTDDFDTATEMVDRAVALNPNSAYACTAKGYLCCYANDPRRAIEAFQRAMRPSTATPGSIASGSLWRASRASASTAGSACPRGRDHSRRS